MFHILFWQKVCVCGYVHMQNFSSVGKAVGAVSPEMEILELLVKISNFNCFAAFLEIESLCSGSEHLMRYQNEVGSHFLSYDGRDTMWGL